MAGMIIGAAVIWALFFAVCFLGTGTDEKNLRSYYSYPDAVQQKIREDETLRAMIPKVNPLINLFYLVLFVFIFLILGAILNIRQFFPAFRYFLVVGEGLNVFDLLVIDMCWWRNTPRTRFSAAPEKALYRDMKKHLVSFGRGIPVFLISALAAAEILSAIPIP